jgi:RNA recognition motif-containing protein
MFTGDSKGFGFVEMPSKNEAVSAIKELTGFKFRGKPIAVNEARPPRGRRKSSRNSRGRRH